MSDLKTWIFTLIGVSILATIVQILTSGSKNEHIVNKCIGIVLSVIIITPAISLLGKSIDFNELTNKTGQFDESFITYTEEYIVNALKGDIKKALENKGLKNSGIEIDHSFSEGQITINYVIIKLDKTVIDENFQHINKCTEAEKAVLSVMNIERERIIIYE